ncbi:MAG: hypothetical protein EHM89_15425 [Acidobacteria bacterium]|nr:MAG: hypothetical protein EHM89_15425 [Acidobacteriota bacterium]
MVMPMKNYRGYVDEKTCPHCKEKVRTVCPHCGKPIEWGGDYLCLFPGVAIAAFIIIVGLKVAGKI